MLVIRQPKITHRFRAMFDVKGFNVSANCNILTSNIVSISALTHAYEQASRPTTVLTFHDDVENHVYDAIEVVSRGIEYAGKDSLSILIENIGTIKGNEIVTGSISLVNPSFERLIHSGYDYAVSHSCKLFLTVSYDSLNVK